jgi:menaquinone-dependent protoporphyrinogen oxidase
MWGKETVMSALVLVGYATQYGSTKEVAEAIEETLREGGLEVDLQPLSKIRTLESYSAVVLGAPLLMFHWHKDALNFLSRHRKSLENMTVAIFALGPTHIPHDEAEWKSSQEQLDKELAKFPWLKPAAIKLFGGKYDPALLRFPLNLMAGKEPASDIRDWEEIRAWAGELKTI